MKKNIKYLLLIFVILVILVIAILPLFSKDKKSEDNGGLFTVNDIKYYKINDKLQGKAEDGEYSKLFDKTKVNTIKINIPENNWNYLIENAFDKPSVLIDSISINDYEIKYAGMKTKGNSSLNGLHNSKNNRFSFTINFGKYINKDNGYTEKQNLLGLKKLSLNNFFLDPSLMKEFLSYKLMTEMGVPTPEYAIANLYINNKLYGVYFMLESIDSSLAKRTLHATSDFITRPEIPGGSLIYNECLNEYLVDGKYVFDNLEYSSDGCLAKYNGLWENEKDTFESVKPMLPTVFEWMKELNELANYKNPNSKEYQKRLEKIIDVDEAIRFFATNAYLVNLDSYTSHTMGNYGLFINENGKATIFPWDYNLAFGYHVRINEAINYDIDNPLFSTSLEERPLFKVIFNNEEYKKRYNEYLKDCTKIATFGGTTSSSKNYEANYFSNIIDYQYNLLRDYYENDPTAFYTIDRYDNATKTLKKFIDYRSTSVNNQLNGNKEPIISNLKTIHLSGTVIQNK